MTQSGRKKVKDKRMAPPFVRPRPLFHCMCILLFRHCLEMMWVQRLLFVLCKNPGGAVFRPVVFKALYLLKNDGTRRWEFSPGSDALKNAESLLL